MVKEVAIRGEYITLGQLIKYTGFVSLGSEEKSFLAETSVLVNGSKETRRGRKLRFGDSVEIAGQTLLITAKDADQKD